MANTALTLGHGRQNSIVAEQTFTFANIADTAVGVNLFKLPVGAVIIGGYINVVVASDIGTSQALAITGGGGTLVAAQDGKATAGTTAAFVATACAKAPLTAAGYVVVTPTNVGTAATVGTFKVIIEYIIAGRADETQP